MSNDAIEFPYRGWLIQVTCDEKDWNPKTKYPRGKNFATIRSSYAFAADAIHALANCVTWTNPSPTMQQLLLELQQPALESRRIQASVLSRPE